MSCTWSRVACAFALAVGSGCGKERSAEPASAHVQPAHEAAIDASIAPTASPARLDSPLDDSQQLLLSISADWQADTATLHRFERDARGAWVRVGEPWATTLGHTGLAWGAGLHPAEVIAADEPRKREGDGKSPAGLFGLGAAYGYDDAFVGDTRLSYRSSSPSLRCVDDPASVHYNQIVDQTKIDKDWSSDEAMRRKDELYRYVIVVDHNGGAGASRPLAGHGSCIFLHVWRAPGSPTVGCTAMTGENMAELIGWLDPTRAPRLLALPQSRYDDLRERWGLPELGR